MGFLEAYLYFGVVYAVLAFIFTLKEVNDSLEGLSWTYKALVIALSLLLAMVIWPYLLGRTIIGRLDNLNESTSKDQ